MARSEPDTVEPERSTTGPRARRGVPKNPINAALDAAEAVTAGGWGASVPDLRAALLAVTGADPGPELTVVMPVWNEGERVVPTLRAFAAAVRTPFELLVVHDMPEDTTVPVVERLSAEIPGLRACQNELGRGVLNAMRAGMAAARAPYVLVTMADGSDDYANVDRMVGLARDGADVVAASRYMPGGQQLGGPRLKRLLSRTAGLTLHWFAGVPIHDATNNFKLYSRRFLVANSIESTAGFELALELSVKATLQGRRLAEVPTTWRDRSGGTSRFRLRRWLPHYLHWYMAAFRGRISRNPQKHR
jgi:glycosyltransferase involved in cell wall biosynthesis